MNIGSHPNSNRWPFSPNTVVTSPTMKQQPRIRDHHNSSPVTFTPQPQYPSSIVSYNMPHVRPLPQFSSNPFPAPISSQLSPNQILFPQNFGPQAPVSNTYGNAQQYQQRPFHPQKARTRVNHSNNVECPPSLF